MPKIEVNAQHFFHLVGQTYDNDILEAKLTSAKAELDGVNEENLKIELNDTNRPDLWSCAGLARALRTYERNSAEDYEAKITKDIAGEGFIDSNIQKIRPFCLAFAAKGKPVSAAFLRDIIQTQEKLAWNFGRKRKSLAIGVYRMDKITFPVHYRAASPSTRFVPLGESESMSLAEILQKHPKGIEYASTLEGFTMYPLLTDDKNEVLSMPPIINSASLGRVEEGNSSLMIEMTGDNMENLALALNIVACDFIDEGFSVSRILMHYPYDTPFGRDVASPFYFQKPLKVHLKNAEKLLGREFTLSEMQKALERMGSKSELVSGEEGALLVKPAIYRNDFLHEVDVIEDVMIGASLESFAPAPPSDFTIGKLLPATLLSRRVASLMIGMGYQQMVFNYLSSLEDYITKMNINPEDVIEIANPMSENYAFLRHDVISSLLKAESSSQDVVYPHKIFEIGKVVRLAPEENTGTLTSDNLGFLYASRQSNYNTIAAEVSALLYYLDLPYILKEGNHPSFISGRQALIMKEDKAIGVFGEVAPEVLEKWQITMPCAACEINVNLI